MAFQPKNAQLLGETYKGIDEQIKLRTKERSLTLIIEKATSERNLVRERRRQLRERNEEIDWQLRRSSLRDVTLPDWRNQIRSYRASDVDDDALQSLPRRRAA